MIPEFHPHKHQWEILQSKYKYIAAIAGFQSGKTTVGAVKLQMESEIHVKEWHKQGKPQNRPCIYMIVAPNEKDLINITFPKFMEYLPKGSYKYSEKDFKLTMNDGRVFLGRSAHNPANLASITASGIWADEAGQYKRAAWKALRPRIKAMRQAGRYTFIIMTTTPNGHNWLYDEVYDKFLSGNPLYHVVQWTSLDNPHFGRDNYEEEREALSPEEFDAMYNGSFTKLSGLVYAFNEEKHVIDESKIPSEYDVVIGGVDFGLASLNAIPIIGIKDGKYYVIDEFEGKCKDYDDISEYCHSFSINYSVKVFYGDPEDKEGMKQLRRSGVKLRVANKQVSEGISHVRRLLNTGNLFISSKCKQVIKEMKVYSYESDGDGSFEEKPKKSNDHLCLVGESKITTIKGEKFIKDIKIGDLVLTRMGYKKVTQSQRTGENISVSKLTTNKGKSIIGTADHPVWIQGKGMTPIRDIQRNDKLLICKRQDAFGQEEAVDLFLNYKKSTVYNLTIDGVHEYFANGILVSNCDSIRYAVHTHPYSSIDKNSKVTINWESITKPRNLDNFTDAFQTPAYWEQQGKYLSQTDNLGYEDNSWNIDYD